MDYDDVFTCEDKVVRARRVTNDSEMAYTGSWVCNVKETRLRIKDSEIAISTGRGKGQVKDASS